MRIGIGWWALLLLALWASYSHAACTTQQLTDEFSLDPKGLGYAAQITAGSDSGVAEILNRIRKAPETGYRVFRGLISTVEVVGAYDPAEYATIMADQSKANQLIGVTNAQQIDTTSTSVSTILSSIFPQGGPTRANLVAIAKTDGSRYQVLCHNGVTGGNATLAEVTAALNPIRP